MRAPAAISGASTWRSTPPSDGSHARIWPDSMTMPVKIYWLLKLENPQHIRADAPLLHRRRQLDVAGEEAGARADLDGRVKDRQTIHEAPVEQGRGDRRASLEQHPRDPATTQLREEPRPDRRT